MSHIFYLPNIRDLQFEAKNSKILENKKYQGFVLSMTSKFKQIALKSAFGASVWLMSCSMMEPDPVCGMEIPSIQNIEYFKGPVSGPFILPATKEKSQTETSADSITFMTMNIQGLPFGFDKVKNWDYRRDRKACISDLPQKLELPNKLKVDAIAIQENFTGIPLEKTMPTAYNIDDHSGLSFSSRLPFSYSPVKAFSECSGIFDCLAKKGSYNIRIKNMAFITAHLNSLRTDEAQQVRRLQCSEIDVPKEGKVLMMGDFNFKRGLPFDEASLTQCLKDKNLTLYARNKKGTDIIAGRGIKINWIAEFKDPNFTDHTWYAVNASDDPASPKPG